MDPRATATTQQNMTMIGSGDAKAVLGSMLSINEETQNANHLNGTVELSRLHNGVVTTAGKLGTIGENTIFDRPQKFEGLGVGQYRSGGHRHHMGDHAM